MQFTHQRLGEKQLQMDAQEDDRGSNSKKQKEDSNITLYPSQQKVQQQSRQFQKSSANSTLTKCIKQQNECLQKLSPKLKNECTQFNTNKQKSQTIDNIRTNRQFFSKTLIHKSQNNFRKASTAKQTHIISKYILLPMNQIDQINYLKRKHAVAHILEVVERNQTYKCNFIHFLIPYALVILTIYSVNRDQQAFLMKIFFFVTKKLCDPDISGQLKKQNYQKYLSFLFNFKTVQYHSAIMMLRQFLEKQVKLTMAVCPYYYNFFAFVINKDIVFGGNHNQPLVVYTINHEHKFYGVDFNPADVLAEVDQIERKLVDKYHSKDI